MSAALVGIIANPASGKDIRRLIAHGSSFDNNEKINIVRRVLVGLDAAGVARVAYMPDAYSIVVRAAAKLELQLDLVPLAMPIYDEAGDSLEAARHLAAAPADVIITLGGDGTNRLVAKGCGSLPIVPISTGTNNVFPTMVEGTLAGLAAGLVATGGAGDTTGPSPVVRQLPRLDVYSDGELKDVALIDVVTSPRTWIGARALWEPNHLSEIVLSRVVPAAIGMASLGALLFPTAFETAAGVHIVVGTDASATRRVRAPVAPGLLREIPIAQSALMQPGETIPLVHEAATVALDGEREFELLSDTRLTVTLNPDGPRVVDIPAALRAGTERGVFVSDG